MSTVENFEMVINVSHLKNTQHYNRAGRALKIIRETVKRHMKVEKVVISPMLGELVTSRGMDKAPAKVRVVITKIDEKTCIVKPAVKVES